MSATMPEQSSPPSWPSLLAWSILLALAVSVPSLTRWASAGRGGVLEFKITAGQPGVAKLFYNRGDGFNDADSSHMLFMAGGPQSMRLPMRPGRYQRLRLDLPFLPDDISIEDVRIRDEATNLTQELDAATIGDFHHIGELRVSGKKLTFKTTASDSLLFLQLPSPLQVGARRTVQDYALMAARFAALALFFALSGRALYAAGARLSRERRVGLYLAVASVLLVAPRLSGLGEPLLDWHDFRQTQTALTAYWFVHEGVSLPAYSLPVLGRPWSAPLEFPTYQFAVAGLYRMGLPLDFAARGFALVSFVASCVLLAWVLWKCGTPGFALLTAGLFAFLSPFALVWSRAALIEFTAVFFGVGYVAFAATAHARGFSALRMGGLLLCGIAAALTKITSFTVFWPAVALLGLHQLWNGRSSRPRTNRQIAWNLLGWSLALAVPLFFGLLWTKQTDAVKAMSESTAWLTSKSLVRWNFGYLSQRLTIENWLIIGRRIHTDVLPWLWPFVFVGVPFLFRLPVRAAIISLGLLAGAAGTVMVFFNLYVVHDYYLSAAVLPLWVAAGAGFHGLARLADRPLIRQVVLCVILAGLAWFSFRSLLVRYAYKGEHGHDLITFTDKVRTVVPPESELIVFGDNWNSRLPYYTKRKALMAWRPIISDEYIVAYAKKNDVRHLVATARGVPALLELFPDARLLERTDAFVLYERAVSPP